MDRAGLVGDDGPTHHGAFDIAYMRPLPNIVMMAPRDEAADVAACAEEGAAIVWAGLVTVQRNQGKALLLFGRYKGTLREQGMW